MSKKKSEVRIEVTFESGLFLQCRARRLELLVPPRIRLQLVSPEEPVAITESDTGLIGALLNVTGAEETRRRTPGCQLPRACMLHVVVK